MPADYFFRMNDHFRMYQEKKLSCISCWLLSSIVAIFMKLIRLARNNILERAVWPWRSTNTCKWTESDIFWHLKWPLRLKTQQKNIYVQLTLITYWYVCRNSRTLLPESTHTHLNTPSYSYLLLFSHCEHYLRLKSYLITIMIIMIIFE